MQHKIKLTLAKKGGQREPLISMKMTRLPKRLVRWILGDATRILILQPGQSLKAVEIFEVPEGEAVSEGGIHYDA